MPQYPLNPVIPVMKTCAGAVTLNPQFFYSKIAAKIAILFAFIGVIGFTGFAYMTKTNDTSDAVQNSSKGIGSYVHIRKPGQSGFRQFSSSNF